jgi:hypothetical protein
MVDFGFGEMIGLVILALILVGPEGTLINELCHR